MKTVPVRKIRKMLKLINVDKIISEIVEREDNPSNYVGKKKWFMSWREFIRRRRGLLLSLKNFISSRQVVIWPGSDIYEKTQAYISNNPGTSIKEAIEFGILLERERVRQIVKELQEKGERCMDQSNTDSDQGSYTFWDGFKNCAENIERSLDQDFDDE